MFPPQPFCQLVLNSWPGWRCFKLPPIVLEFSFQNVLVPNFKFVFYSVIIIKQRVDRITFVMLDRPNGNGGGILAERRTSIPYLRSNSVSFRSDTSNLSIIIGKSFGPFTRCASLQTQQLLIPTTGSLQSEKSIGDVGELIPLELDNVNDEESNKLRLVTSRTATQPPIDYDDTVAAKGRNTRTISSQNNVARTEEINSRYRVPATNRATTTRTRITVTNRQADYKFLRRQFSMDQYSFHISPVGGLCPKKGRSGRTESVNGGVGILGEVKVLQTVIQENVNEGDGEEVVGATLVGESCVAGDSEETVITSDNSNW